MTPLKVCIVGLKCYDHIAGRPVPRYLGGIETQLVALAKGLVLENCEVSLITFDHGQQDGEVFAGVTVLKSHPPEGGLPGLRALHPRSTGLWKAMRRSGADVFLQMGAGAETGQTALGCRFLPGARRRFAFCMASDANFGAHLTAGRWGLEGRIYRYGLRHADRIIAQTVTQKAGLHNATGMASEVIPMAAVPPFSGQSSKDAAQPGHVLWVGRITQGKRLEWLIEAARRCPAVIFDVVGTPNKDSDYATAILAAAAAQPNVRVHGRASGEQLSELYRQCALVCCTSTLEGFPTTFLEAWSCGIPVVTTVDPDGVVARHRLGLVAGDQAALIAQLSTLLENPDVHADLSASASRYYRENHALETVSRRFRTMLQTVVNAPIGHEQTGSPATVPPGA